MEVRRRGARPEARLEVLLLVTTCAAVACAFNVDVKFAVKVSAPPEAAEGFFGFSVALASAEGGGSWLLVGAPRADPVRKEDLDRRLTAVGATYRCRITSRIGPCSQIQFESEDGEDDFVSGWGSVERNDSFLGATLDVRPEGSVVACNPNWKIQRSTEDGYTLQMPGACFFKESTDTSDFKRIINTDALRKETDDRSPNWYSQMGSSVNFVGHTEENSDNILMGVPGAWNGKGSAALLKDTNANPIYQKSPLDSLNNSSYFGYSVGAGVFGPSKTFLYVSGAPRAGVLKGKVFLFRFETENEVESSIVMDKEFTGGETGEYFGASIAVVDLNGDGMDDLLVGAPLRSYEKGDEGGVYVFASSAKGELKQVGEEPAIMGSKQPGARFGTTITVLGDINHDGYQDIAVGAPYEDELKGAVYIYQGRPTSPFLKLAQKIRARDIDNSLQAFGYSISKGKDIDNNTFSDIAVGAYLSNDAIILRTSPVIYINAYWSSNFKKINTSSEFLNMSLCLSFGGFSAPDPVQVEVKIHLDPVYNRAYFADLRVKDIYNASLTYGRQSCRPLLIVGKNFTKIFKPLEVALGYTIKSTATSFCATCPILDPENNTATLYIPYETGCDSGDCKIDVELHGNFVNVSSPYVVGNGSKIEFVMNVSNSLEPSYETNVSVNITAEISLAQIDRFCQKLDKKDWNVTALQCTVPKTLERNVKAQEIRLLLDGNSAPWGVRELVVSAVAVGSGEEFSPDDNAVTRSVLLHHDAEIYTLGRSQPPSLSYTVKQNKSDEIIYQDKLFKHTFQVNNEGPSSVDDVIIRFMIPSIITLGSETFNLTNIDEKRLPESIYCDKSLSDGPINTSFLVNASHLKSDFELPDTYLMVDCSLSNVQCLILECSVSHSILARSGVSITLEMIAFLRQLGPVIEEGAILLHTWAAAESAHIKNENLPNNKSDTCVTETLFLGQRPALRIQPWIIILAILFGIFLLGIVILILWKIGFFKRKTPPEEQDLIETGPIVSVNDQEN